MEVSIRIVRSLTSEQASNGAAENLDLCRRERCVADQVCTLLQPCLQGKRQPTEYPTRVKPPPNRYSNS